MQVIKYICTRFSVVFGTTIGLINYSFAGIQKPEPKDDYETMHLAAMCVGKAYMYHLFFPLPLLSMAYGVFSGDKNELMKHLVPNSVYGLPKFRQNFRKYAEEQMKN